MAKGRRSLKRIDPKWQNLHPMVLMVCVLLVCAVLTYIIPAGNYERITQEEGAAAEVMDVDSFTYVERSPATPMQLLMSLTLGLQRGADVVFYLLIIGGMFAILNGTNAINVGMANILVRLRKREWLIIPLFMIFFGCGSAFCGNFEEFLVFVPLVLACCITVGFDSLTAVAIIFCAAAAGYGGSITNAFNVGIAQELAGVPRFSGIQLRSALFLVLLFTAIVYVTMYARMIRKKPKLSGAYAFDRQFNQDKRLNLAKIPRLTKRQAVVILIFLCGMAFSVWGIIAQGYYIDELSAVFLAVGIIGGVIGGLRPGEICARFEKGCRDMLLPALLIGLANGAVHLLESAQVMDTILYYLASVLNKMPTALVGIGMFGLHEVFNIFVPSASAQARITMPLMISIADKVNMTRQTAVLAYQLGDSFTNILVPTGGEILAALAICRVPFGKWLRFLLPLFALWCVIAVLFIMFAVKTGFGPL